MKNQYDKNCVSRTFRPGDKVLALLHVPGNTLQARYFCPYLTEKKENDLTYVIVTPERRKTKQLCHVNMLKSYYGRKSGVQVVNTIEIGNNTDVADTTELFNLSESTKHSLVYFYFILSFFLTINKVIIYIYGKRIL